MNLDSIIFPAPKPNYTSDNPDLIFIPSTLDNEIPCLFLKSGICSNNVILYFHGNAEDIGNSFLMMKYFVNYLNINILIVEYPSYGIYKNKTPSEKNIYEDSEYVLDFLIKILKFKKKNIIILGRSIGCSPSIYLSTKHLLNSLILITPFTTLRNAAKSFVGSSISYLLKERFLNIDNIKKNHNPLLVIHGDNDKIIPLNQGVEIFKNSPSKIKKLIIPNNMTHNKFNIYEDILKHISEFLKLIENDFEKNNLRLDYLEMFRKK